jgi:hypothetical protein
METTAARTISGRTLVTLGLLVAALVVLGGVLLGPPLREDVLQLDVPRTLREPIASGRYQGQVWEAVGRYDGTANCVELRYRSSTLHRACDVGDRVASRRVGPGGPTIAYGVAPETQSSVTVTLDDGSQITTPAVAGDLGFPVAFWAVELPPGRALRAADTGT